MNPPILNVQDLIVHFPVTKGIFRKTVGCVHAVNGVSMSINPGEILGIVGETGSGKSTIARAALRLIEPTSGKVEFQGENILKMPEDQLNNFRRKAQIVFQNPFSSLNPRKSICDSIGESLLYHNIVRTRKEQREKVAELLRLVGLSPESMHRYPHQFSGGQQQRICIARALALDPKLIILDEAVSALDVSVQAQILNLLQELQEKLSLSYLFISHDLSLVKYLCHRVVVLYLGKIMEEASVEEIFENPKHPYTQALLSAVPKSYPGMEKQRMILKGEIPSPLHPPSGCPFRTRCPYAKPICAETPPTKTLSDPYTGLPDHHYHCIL